MRQKLSRSRNYWVRKFPQNQTSVVHEVPTRSFSIPECTHQCYLPVVSNKDTSLRRASVTFKLLHSVLKRGHPGIHALSLDPRVEVACDQRTTVPR